MDPSLKLRRLKIDRFRDIAPGTELRFDDGINVLLGRNGTGKTTLLELISMAVRTDFTALEDVPLSLEYELVAGDVSIQIEMKSEGLEPLNPSEGMAAGEVLGAVSLGGEPRADAAGRERRVRATSEVVLRSPHGDARYQLEPGSTRRFDAETADQLLQERPMHPLRPLLNDLWRDAFGTNEPDGRRVINHGRTIWPILYWRQQCVRFDESLEFFGKVFNPDPGTGVQLWVHVPPLTARTSAFPAANRGFVPGVLLDALARLDKRRYDDSTLRLHSSEFPLLASMASALGFDGAEWRFEVAARRRDEKTQEIFYARPSILFRRQSGSTGVEIGHELLSYGEKRMLAFLYYAGCNSQILIADELVNGLHHDWIENCLREIGSRQAFLTSQNPLLLDYLPIASPEQAQRMFILCSVDRSDPALPRRHWAHMPEEEAAEFHADYATHVQHTSDILINRGLW